MLVSTRRCHRSGPSQTDRQRNYPIFLNEQMKTHTHLIRPPAWKLGMDPGSPLPTIKEQGLNPAGLPATADDLGLPATADDLGPVLPAPGSIAMLIWRAEMRTGWLGELKWGGCHPCSPEPRLLHGGQIQKGSLQLPMSRR